MIVDVRMNGGGNDALAFSIASRFFDVPRLVRYVRYRSGPAHSFDSRQVEVVAAQFEFQNGSSGISFCHGGHGSGCIQTDRKRCFNLVNDREFR